MARSDVLKVVECGVVEWNNFKKSSHKLLFAAGGKHVNTLIRLESQTMKMWGKKYLTCIINAWIRQY